MKGIIPGEISINAQNNAVSSCVSRKALYRVEKPNMRSINVAPSSNADFRRVLDTVEEPLVVVGRNMTPASPSMKAA